MIILKGGDFVDRYTWHILLSIIVIVVPVIGLVFGIWDMNKAQVGVYQPKQGPSLSVLLVIIGTIGLGVTNLVIAIQRYNKNKKR
jgi:ABC-type proline/glycine betaine transport system permease subunit